MHISTKRESSADSAKQPDEVIAEMSVQIAALQHAVVERGRAISRLHQELHTLENANQELERQKQSLVQMWMSSFSWKLTIPVRMVGDALRNLRGFLSGNKAPVQDEIPATTGPQVQQERDDEAIRGLDSDIAGRAVRDMLDRARAYGSSIDGYVHRIDDRVDAKLLDVKAIAFYSTRDRLDEWSKVAAAVPRYLGQYQPQLPGEFGFYDARLPQVLQRQIELARQYGIFGFCFQHYWSGAETKMPPPMDHLLLNPDLDIAFCICWMNSGLSTSTHRDLGFVDSISSALLDPRYLRINGKPVLIVFDPAALADADATLRYWRNRAVEIGLSGLYLIAVRSTSAIDTAESFDSLMEYPPYEANLTDLASRLPLIDSEFRGRVVSYPELVETQTRAAEPSFVNFKTVMTAWDTEAQSPGAGYSFIGATPALYGKWLRHACEITRSRPFGQRFVFLNAWNDWTNGAHLEPDRRLGFAHLHVTANTLRQYFDDAERGPLIETVNAKFARKSDVAVILHCYYEDLIGPVFDKYISNLQYADVFVTARPDLSRTGVMEIRDRGANVFIQCEENRGRDIRPFLLALRRVQGLGYKFVCKVHTKKAPHLDSGLGDKWRERLMDNLLGSSVTVKRALQLFSDEPDVGLIAAPGSLMDLRRTSTHMFNTASLNRLLDRMNRPDLIWNYEFEFPAGSMFWFRVDALADLHDFVLRGDEFEPECGQTDGTLAHAVERIFSIYARQRGYRTIEIAGR